MYTNLQSAKLKNGVTAYFNDLNAQLSALWSGLKKERMEYKALNNVIAGLAGGERMKPYQWLILNFASRYVDADGLPLKRFKKEDGTYIYKSMKLTGATARGLLKKAALNAIESQREGNKWTVTTIL